MHFNLYVEKIRRRNEINSYFNNKHFASIHIKFV